MVIKSILIAALLINIHSWYPPECCAGKDCKEVPCSSITEEGKNLVYTENGKKYFIEQFKNKPSPDDSCHVCIWPGTQNMRCIFIPIRST